jgi:hypothetical protein
VDHADFFTLGYEGKTTAQIIELLKGAVVRRSLLEVDQALIENAKRLEAIAVGKRPARPPVNVL